jgi:hypothetical protein
VKVGARQVLAAVGRSRGRSRGIDSASAAARPPCCTAQKHSSRSGGGTPNNDRYHPDDLRECLSLTMLQVVCNQMLGLVRASHPAAGIMPGGRVRQRYW